MPRKLNFADSEKIREIYDRFGANKKLGDRSSMEYGITQWRRIDLVE